MDSSDSAVPAARRTMVSGPCTILLFMLDTPVCGRIESHTLTESQATTMYALVHKQMSTYRTLALGIAMVYVLITWAVPFLHDDDCPAAHANRRAPLDSDRPCAACNFLSSAQATGIHWDSTPGLTPLAMPPEFTCDSVVAITSPFAGSIFLRAPPLLPLS